MVEEKAAELKDAADSHDMKRFYHVCWFYNDLKAVYGPRVSSSVQVLSADG